MRNAPPASVAASHSGGFALIIVLWALVLIAFITAHLVATGRTEIRIASNLVANGVTHAAVDGAIYQTIFDLMDPQPQSRWSLDGSVREFTIGNCRVTVKVTDEAGRINPNLAAPALLEALLRVTGNDAATAHRLATAIGEWVGLQGVAESHDALLTEYRTAGLDNAPPGERMENLAELRRVLYMTPAVFDAIRPHVSLFAPTEPIAAHADPMVVAALASLARTGIVQPNVPLTQPNTVTARIAATARGPGNARAARTAIVRIVSGSGKYTILAWDDDSATE